MSETYPARFDVQVHAADDLPLPPSDQHIEGTYEPEANQRDNNLRAMFAAKAVRSYASRTHTLGEPIETTIGDLLSDLRHLCDAVSVDFDELVNYTVHYDAELRGEF